MIQYKNLENHTDIKYIISKYIIKLCNDMSSIYIILDNNIEILTLNNGYN